MLPAIRRGTREQRRGAGHAHERRAARRLVHEHGFTGRHDADEAELESVRALRPVLRELLTADRDRAAELVNGLLAEAQAVPQLRRHDGLDWHIHAVPSDAPLARRVAVEVAMAMIDVIRADELSRLAVCIDDRCEGLVLDLSQPLAPLLQHHVREPKRRRRLSRARPAIRAGTNLRVQPTLGRRRAAHATLAARQRCLVQDRFGRATRRDPFQAG